MSLTTTQPMRRCGRRWATEEDALHSKAYLAGGQEVISCFIGCGGFHLQPEVKSAPTGTGRKSSKDSGPESFPAAVCMLIDTRDSDDSTGHPVRLCQGCGTTRGLHRHHRRGKDAGGSSGRSHTHCCCNALTLCTDCHNEAHAHPEEARAMGWIVSQSEDEPDSVGVMRFAAAEGSGTQWPSCGGRWLETSAEAREAA